MQIRIFLFERALYAISVERLLKVLNGHAVIIFDDTCLSLELLHVLSRGLFTITDPKIPSDEQVYLDNLPMSFNYKSRNTSEIYYAAYSDTLGLFGFSKDDNRFCEDFLGAEVFNLYDIIHKLKTEINER